MLLDELDHLCASGRLFPLLDVKRLCDTRNASWSTLHPRVLLAACVDLMGCGSQGTSIDSEFAEVVPGLCDVLAVARGVGV